MAGTGTAHLRAPEDVLLRVEHLVVDFPTRGGKVSAVADVSFDVAEGETLGLVGESGCGKSTAARAVMQLPSPTAGAVWFEGRDLATMHGERLRAMRPRIQIVFQDPISSLNPRRTVAGIVGDPLRIWNQGTEAERRQKVDEVLETVGLDPAVARDKRPHEFSGGQCQRICIARSLVLEPKVLICDEPVSALDVSVQAQILNLLEDLKARYGLTMVFITHDLAVVKNISDRVAVMYLGKICEIAGPDRLYASPAHPYSAALLSSIPVPDPDAENLGNGLIPGELPSPLSPPSGCRFRTRCPRAESRCAEEEPQIRQVADGQYVACHFPLVGERATTPESMVAAPVPAATGNGAGSESPGETDSPSDAPAGTPDLPAPTP
jgi:peptide/nickel transport system ATP-binding protein